MERAQQRKISLRRIGRRGGRNNPSQRQKAQRERHDGATDLERSPRGVRKCREYNPAAHRTEGREKQPVPTSEAEWTDGNLHLSGKRTVSTQLPHPEKRTGEEPEPDEQQLRPRAHKP